MPLGWYLAQGLYPLGPSSSDDEEGPCELPDGRLVCGPHGFVTCGKCCTDYSFMDDVLSDDREDEDDEEDEDSDDDDDDDVEKHEDGHLNSQNLQRLSSLYGEKRRGTGRVIPTKFTPPQGHVTPTEVFRGQRTYANLTRYVHRSNPLSVLVFTDGACLNDGQPNPKAGWAFVHGPGLNGKPADASGRLENKGPFGDESIQSSNRAELRAVIAALRFRHWVGEGFHTMTIATDSEYVVEGSTNWARTWVKNGWKTSGDADVKNKDLWEMLLGEFERWKNSGLAIQFWRIPRDWNKVADAAAKKAAAGDEVIEWREMMGLRI